MISSAPVDRKITDVCLLPKCGIRSTHHDRSKIHNMGKATQEFLLLFNATYPLFSSEILIFEEKMWFEFYKNLIIIIPFSC